MKENKNFVSDAKNSKESSAQVCLWHTAGDIFSLESFVENGAQPIGQGMGGQSNGFYVWNQKEYAISHFSDFLYKDEEAETLLVCTKVDKNDLKYPDWQFDLEISEQLNALLFEYQDRISEIKDLKYKDDKGKEIIINSLEISNSATPEECWIIFRKGNGSTCLSIGDGGMEGVDMFQALIDRMCENKDFRDDYNKLLQDSIEEPHRLALKYCGKESLFVNEISYIQKKEHADPVEHTIYKAEKENNDVKNSFSKNLKPMLSEDLLQLKMNVIKEKLGPRMGKTADIESGKYTEETLDTAETQQIISKLLMKTWRKMKD